ncbi:MAG: sugar ABC transporter permease [Chloroflexia bacterium]|nr:sugar ABC transporter permease [Chloroflexia bacterium]
MATLARPRRGSGPLAAEDRIAGLVFILPSLLVFIAFIFGPVLFAFWVSLFERDTIGRVNTFVGLDNYQHILTNNPDFNIALRNTVWFAVGVVPVQTAVGLILAVLANRKIRGRTFFRTAFYFPSISSSVVISLIFLWLYAQNGLINFLLRQLGFPTPRPPWLSNPKGVVELVLNGIGISNVPDMLAGPSVALLSIMMLNVWTTAGTMMVIFLAGLQDVPGDVYEAASLDGASRVRMFWDITVPLLRPVTLFVVTLGLIGTFQVFDQIYVMSAGGPAKTTTTVAYYIYIEAFKFGRGLGYASALAVVLFAIIFVLFLIQRRLMSDPDSR